MLKIKNDIRLTYFFIYFYHKVSIKMRSRVMETELHKIITGWLETFHCFY